VVTSIDDIVREITTNGVYSAMMHVFALSAALGLVIRSYIPPTSVNLDYTAMYTCDVVGRGVMPTGPPKFTIMWSAASAPASPTELTVNHVVWLAKRGQDVAAPDSQVSEESDVECDHSVSSAQSDAGEAGRQTLAEAGNTGLLTNIHITANELSPTKLRNDAPADVIK